MIVRTQIPTLNPNLNLFFPRYAQNRLRLRLGLRLGLEAPTPKSEIQLRAFTLIELTISAAVASIILVASYICLSAGVASQKLIEPRTEVLQSARVALAMMSADLRSACSLCPDFDFVGEQRQIGEMDADNLDFATHYYMPTRSSEGDYCQVSYFVDKGRGTNRFSLWRRRNPHIAPDPLAGGSREEIVSGLRGLTLEYYDGLDWYDNWGDASIKKRVKYTTEAPPNLSGFPEAVRITLLLDPNPGKTAEKQEPPLAFQTVVRLELADVPASTGVGASDNSTPPAGNNGAQPGPNPGGGGN
jgi:prepilin-type N-terminal cleavage/methylation domain-containing protein